MMLVQHIATSVYPDVKIVDVCFLLTVERGEVDVDLVGDVAHHATRILVAVGIGIGVVCGGHCGWELAIPRYWLVIEE